MLPIRVRMLPTTQELAPHFLWVIPIPAHWHLPEPSPGLAHLFVEGLQTQSSMLAGRRGNFWSVSRLLLGRLPLWTSMLTAGSPP